MAVGAAMLTVIAGCSPQQSASQASGGAQVASTGEKCEVDVKRICEELRNQPVIDSQTGQTQDTTEREQNSARTDSRFMSIQVPNGSMIEVQCEINAQHNSVVYAHMMPGPPLTPTDIAFVRNAGYCAQ